MKTIVDQIVEEARRRNAHLHELLREQEDSVEQLRGRVMESDHHLNNVEQAAEVMYSELGDVRARFEAHTHTPECKHDVITMPDIEQAAGVGG